MNLPTPKKKYEQALPKQPKQGPKIWGDKPVADENSQPVWMRFRTPIFFTHVSHNFPAFRAAPSLSNWTLATQENPD
jgi:hypothetical protein